MRACLHAYVRTCVRAYVRTCVYTSIDQCVPACNSVPRYVFVLVCCYNFILGKGGPKIMHSESREAAFPCTLVPSRFPGIRFNQLVDFNVGMTKSNWNTDDNLLTYITYTLRRCNNILFKRFQQVPKCNRV